MTEREKKVIVASGRRKRAIARASIRAGKGKVRINHRALEAYSPEFAKMVIQEPLIIAGDAANKVDITVNVFGGGWASQAEAARLAIANALVKFTGSPDLKKRYLDYDRHLIVADTRYRESRKPLTHSKARSGRQTSYR